MQADIEELDQKLAVLAATSEETGPPPITMCVGLETMQRLLAMARSDPAASRDWTKEQLAAEVQQASGVDDRRGTAMPQAEQVDLRPPAVRTELVSDDEDMEECEAYTEGAKRKADTRDGVSISSDELDEASDSAQLFSDGKVAAAVALAEKPKTAKLERSPFQFASRESGG